ncbi:TonB-dependent receptor [Tamlana sp. 2201CG12-4]|uniref:SusC/RagA family TonB-linked outer membrane protein n=1 Tax=Tamlana sp. 2201CG12-4 TaxID=3112582 RepID=UPI002DB6ED93|nr:TonB-dependent receptor [Tamlana sp. 2201CG12-4]MEC3908666.1 TonB-dependent receptor [Tamlana sp. 2201CG12-4]
MKKILKGLDLPYQLPKFDLKMKLFTLCMFAALLTVQANNSYAQRTKISLDLENVPVKQLIDEIENSTDFRFVYRVKDVNLKRLVSIKAKKESIVSILDHVFKNTKTTYAISSTDNQIHLTERKNKLPVITPVKEQKPQGIKINGTVFDTNGTPLPGANILEKGTSNGTQTDFDGLFSLEVADDNAVLVVSYIGFITQEVSIKNQTSLSITLIEDIASLEQVVVVGYGTQSKRDLTGSIASVKTDEFENQPVTRVDQILQGRAPGVNVINNSGAPGGTVSIRIRGANSINGSNEPLYVIDGFVGSNFQDINPTDIESIQVLKDASATAIYGSRGSNGVVLITTKSGKTGKSQISLTTRFSVSSVLNEWDVMDAATFAEVVNQRASDLGTPDRFTPEEIAGFRANGGTDWQDELFDTAYGEEVQLDYSGGSENINYFISGNYLSQEGVLLNSEFEKIALRANLGAKISDKLKTTLKLNFNSRESNNIAGSGNINSSASGPLSWAPTTPARDENGILTTRDPISSIQSNPIELAQNDNIAKANVFTANGSFNYEIIEGLTLDIGYGLNYINTKTKGYTANTLNGSPSASQGAVENVFMQNSNNLTYRKTFNEIHEITATAVVEHQFRNVNGFNTTANGLLFPELKFDNLTLADNFSVGSFKREETLRSYIGRINYELLDRYLLTASVRTDGSSKFRKENRYSTFPSVAFGWRISEEAFMKDSFFNDLKFRGSWGKTGSQAIDVFGTVTTFNTSEFNAGGAFTNGSLVSGIAVGNPGNENLKWETTAQWNVGLDATVINNRLGFSLDYYKKNTTDLLLNEPLPDYLGGGRITKNLGEVENYGYEFSINATLFDNDSFKWYSTLNASYTKNEIVDIGDQDMIFLDGGVGGGITNISESVLKPGYSLSSYWGLNYLGTWKSDEAAEAATFGNVPGDSRYEDISGDGTIGPDDFQIIGSGLPTTVYGWNNTLEIKDFTLNFFFLAMTGFDKWNLGYGTGIMSNGASREPVLADIQNRWDAVTNPNSNIPHFSATNVNELQSSRFIEKGDFLRLKNVSIAYNLPKEVLKGVQAQFMLSGTNLWTITNYKGLDPEAYNTVDNSDTGGADAGSYPNSRTFTVGANFKF